MVDPAGSSSSPYAATETAVRLLLNGSPVACFHCTPRDVGDMAVGWLVGEGIIAADSDHECSIDNDGVLTVRVDAPGANVAAVTDGSLRNADCGRWVSPGNIALEGRRLPTAMEHLVAEPALLRPLFNEMFERAELRKAGGGMHTGAVIRDGTIERVVEDVGRHNLIDKLIGGAVRANVDLGDRMFIGSARVSGTIALKLWRSGVPAVATLSVPTTMAREIAARCGLTIIGRSLKQSPFVYPASG